MKILLSGGGTGGHITPILAVAEQIRFLQPDTEIFYVGERNGNFQTLLKDVSTINEKYAIYSGKFRRYHGENWIKRITDVSTIFKNLRDGVFVFFGFIQSVFLLRRIKPDAVFLKGGYVGVPVGLAAAFWRIPIVTHDSDALPGLANRVISRWAKFHTTALPAQYYNYPPLKVKPVGVLVEKNYQPVTDDIQKQFKKQIGIPENHPLLLITGGSSGATRLNKAILGVIEDLMKHQPELYVIHQVGQGKMGEYKDFKHERVQVTEFMNPMFVYTGAADLIATRAGANALSEFGVQGKACVVIPSAFLAGGHQTKNAEILKEQGSAVVLEETSITDSPVLLSTLEKLLNDESKRRELAEKLQKSTITGASQKVAKLLIETAKTNSN